MKIHILTTIILLGALGSASKAQDVIRQAPCSNELINHQADSIKEVFSKQGYIVLKEASMTMESEYEMPIIVPLSGGSWYQIVFIGDIGSKLSEVRMYDSDDHQVYYQKNLSKDVDGNIISYRYIPGADQYHIIKPVQVNKKNKKPCGYVMLMKRVR